MYLYHVTELAERSANWRERQDECECGMEAT